MVAALAVVALAVGSPFAGTDEPAPSGTGSGTGGQGTQGPATGTQREDQHDTVGATGARRRAETGVGSDADETGAAGVGTQGVGTGGGKAEGSGTRGTGSDR
jgi:hypothetical protein